MASTSQEGGGSNGGRSRTLGPPGSVPDIVTRDRGQRERQREQAGRQSRSLDSSHNAAQRGKMKINSNILSALKSNGTGGSVVQSDSSQRATTPRRPAPTGPGGSTTAGPGPSTTSAPGPSICTDPGPSTSAAPGSSTAQGSGQPSSSPISKPVTRVTVSMAAASSAPRTSANQPSTGRSPRTMGRNPAPGPSQARDSSPAPPRPMSIASDNSVTINISDERQLLGNYANHRDSRGQENAGAQQDIAQIHTDGLGPGVSLNRFETNEALPDILNSHLLPPYTSPRPNQSRSSRQNGRRSPSNGQVHTRQPGHSGRSRRRAPGPVTTLNDGAKGCCTRDTCLDCITAVTTFRWVLVTLAMLGVCCVVTGIILGALHMTIGSSFLTLSLMFIGLGVMLVVVVGVGWRCTPPGHEPCHLLFNLGDHSNRELRSHRTPRHHRDRNAWYGGVLYPEFRHRRPPPSYNVSMQEYQQQLMLAQLQQNPTNQEGGADDVSLPSSPPPTYRSRASTAQRPGLHITFPLGNDGSRPPTYRSHMSDAGDRARPALPMDSDMNSVQVTIETHRQPGSAEPRPQVLPPSGPEDSTLYRAAQVVQYLDNILLSEGGDSTDCTTRSNTPSAAASRKSSVDSGARKQGVLNTTQASGSSAGAPYASLGASSSSSKTIDSTCMSEGTYSGRIVADTPL